MRDLTLIEEVKNSESEDVVSVVLPYSSEVGLISDWSLDFVREGEGVLLDDLRCELRESVNFLLELSSTLWGGGVNTEDEFVILISVSEGENFLLSVLKVTTMSHPVRLGDFVVEKS